MKSMISRFFKWIQKPDFNKLPSEHTEQTEQRSMNQYEGIHGLLMDQWKGDKPVITHAWVRHILSVGVKQDEYMESLRGLKKISHAFDRKAIVLPVILGDHEIEICQFHNKVDPETGQWQIEAEWPKIPVGGGTHLLLAVESDAEEIRQGIPFGVKILDAIESCIRLSLGADVLKEVRTTVFMEIQTGKQQIPPASFTVFGPEQFPRTGSVATSLVTDLIGAHSNLPEDKAQQLLMGLRWLQIAFDQNELLSYWTAFEILAGGYGERRIFKLLAEAYQHIKPQKLGIDLGVKHVADVRNAQSHYGSQINLSHRGVSYLLGVADDLCRQLAGLQSERSAERVLKGLDNGLEREISTIGGESGSASTPSQVR